MPIKMMTIEFSENVGPTQEPITHFPITVWEDNAGALKLAPLEPGMMITRSKWYGIKYQWFRRKLKPTFI
jgi:hypothetical protein